MAKQMKNITFTLSEKRIANLRLMATELEVSASEIISTLIKCACKYYEKELERQRNGIYEDYDKKLEPFHKFADFCDDRIEDCLEYNEDDD